MPWLRFDDQFSIHRKVDGLSDAAFRLHVSAIFWCARNLTDGFVPEEDLDIVCARVRTPTRFAAELVKRKLWNIVDNGWQIHDYLDYQFSAEQVKQERKGNAERQRRWRDRQRGVETERRSEGNASNNAVSNGVINALPVQSRPVVVVDVGKSSSVRNARAEDEELVSKIEKRIVAVLAEETGVTVTPQHAAKVRGQILDDRDVAKPVSYVTQALRKEPRRFLPADTGPARLPADLPRYPPLGERDNPANATGAATVRAAIRKNTSAPKEATP